MVPSPQQQAVLDWVVNGQGSANVVARAGCGKTSTLLMAAEKAAGDVAMLAYNKSIAEEIKAKLAKQPSCHRVQAMTVHSAGFSAWRKVAPGVKVDDRKVAGIISNVFSTEKGDEWDLNLGVLCKMVSLAKQSAFGFLVPYTELEAWFALAEHHDLEDDINGTINLGEVVQMAVRVFKQSLAMDNKVIDFDDMILAPLVHNTRVRTYDWVFMDEAQDTNASRRALALKMLKPETGRFIAVGDDRQAIYGFTGADSDAMDLIKQELHSVVLPLTVTYRCPKKVVEMANFIVEDLTAHESAPEGETRTLPLVKDGVPWFMAEKPVATSVILCRNTKPLVEQAYSMIRYGMGCRIEGRDIGEGLVKLVTRRKKISSLHDLSDYLEEYKATETQKWIAKGKETKAQQVTDQCDTAKVLVDKLIEDGKREVADLVTFIRSLFGDSRTGETPRVVTLSTIHKSKGREWPTVYLLDRAGTLPSKWARKEWQLNQEANLEYVAITRAKNSLVDLVRPKDN